GFPEPPSPAAVRAASAEMRRSPEEHLAADDTLSANDREVRLRDLQRQQRRTKGIGTDADVQHWLLHEAPVECHEDRLDLNDGRRGIISRRARQRYEGRLSPRSNLIPFSLPSVAEQSGWDFDGGPPE